MIFWLALGLALLAVALFLGRAALAADPKALAKAMRYAGAAALGLGGLYFLFIGRIEAAMTLGFFALMALGRLGSWRGWRPAGTPGQSTQVETEYLRMVMDHDSGEVEGTILKGPHRGRRLAELGRAELIALHAECRVSDPQAVTLLETYFDRLWGPEWRAEAGGGPAGAARAGGGAMTPEEARAVLGVGPKAGPDEIREAYHRLMKKVHPDQGGSTYLASQINAAKDVLLGD